MRQLQNVIGRSEATQMSITVLIISGMESLKMRITHLKGIMRQLQNVIGRSKATQMSITVLITSGMESLKMRITHLKGMNEGVLVSKSVRTLPNVTPLQRPASYILRPP